MYSFENLSPEQIRDKLNELLCRADVANVLSTHADAIAAPLPEIVPMFGFEQHNPYHDKDVWLHTVAVVANIPPEPVLRWAALLHDIGKPDCFSLDDNGIGHFYGHARRSTELAEGILTRLGFVEALRERILHLIHYHDAPLPTEEKPLRRFLRKHGEEIAGQLLALHRADTLGQSALCQSRLAGYDALEAQIRELLISEDRSSQKGVPHAF